MSEPIECIGHQNGGFWAPGTRHRCPCMCDHRHEAWDCECCANDHQGSKRGQIWQREGVVLPGPGPGRRDTFSSPDQEGGTE